MPRRHREPGWYQNVWVNWPYNLNMNDILEFSTEGVLPVSLSILSEIDFAFALPLCAGYLMHRPRDSPDDEVLNEALQRLNQIQVAVYYTRGGLWDLFGIEI